MSDSERLPALCRGLVVVTAPAGVVIEGGPHRILLEGEAAKAFVPRLLPFLDGEHRVADACAQLSVVPARVRQAVRLLDDWGVIEGGTRPPGGVPEESVVFHSRLLAPTRGRGGTGELLHELAGARVLLAVDGDEEFASRLREDLTASGVGAVETAGDPAESSLAVVLDVPGRPEALDSLVRAAHSGGVPVLRIAFAEDAVEAGPLFCAADSACVACFRRDHDAGGMVLTHGGTGTRELLAGVAATEVLAVLAATTAVGSLNTLMRVSLSDWATEHYLFVPHDDCGVETERPDGHDESGEPDVPDEQARLIEGYEWYQALPPPGLNAKPRLLAPEKQQLEALRRQRPRRMSVPARGLPPEPDLPPLDGDRPPKGTSPVGRAKLAGLLTWAAGYRGAGTEEAGTRRWAPSGGGLGSVELYVVAESDPFGLPGTVFAYDDMGHRMLSVRADAVPLKSALGATGPNAADVDAAIVLVATVGRLLPRYGSFSWRLAHLDAGFTAMQLAAAARGYGLRASFASTWADDLADVLQLDPASECVAAVVGVAGTARGEDL
ncbi:nitroreductase family protein [Streptomyces sp. MAR4 CNX-425]|uniref:nitroreductase family protein n=1 Tax=Streptomyces sp. MAR4 CNX-425 TaxID=3406343 RepID=UPI003B4FFBCF